MAGFLDKAKAVAQQALDEAKKGVEQGQAKLDEASAKREASRLLAALGAAFYAEQRSGGPRGAVDSALQAVDQFVSVNGTAGFPDAEPSAAPPAPAPAPPPPPTSTPPPTAPPAGGAPSGSAYDVPPPSE